MKSIFDTARSKRQTAAFKRDVARRTRAGSRQRERVGGSLVDDLRREYRAMVKDLAEGGDIDPAEARDQIIENIQDSVKDVLNRVAGARGFAGARKEYAEQVRALGGRVNPEERDQIIEGILENVSEDLNEIADQEGKSTLGIVERALAPRKFPFKSSARGRYMDRMAKINRRRAAHGKKALGHPGDKPGHPFRGNQYS